MKTTLIVRAIARGGKFIGDLVGGYGVSVEGLPVQLRFSSSGSSGNTADLMQQQRLRTSPLPTNPDPIELPLEWAAAAAASVDLAAPLNVTVTVTGPGKFPAQQVNASVNAWLLPGVGFTGDARFTNGLVLELPGLLVQRLVARKRRGGLLAMSANVTMMCGCKIIDNDGIWISSDFTVIGQVLDGAGAVLASVPLVYVPYPQTEKNPSLFTATTPFPSGAAAVQVLAYQHSMANTGFAAVAIS